MHLKTSSVKWRPFCLGLNVLTHWPLGNFNEILYIIFKPILVIDRWGISFEIAIIWLSLDFTNDQSILVQVMAWCSQWVGVGGFSKVVAIFNHVGGSFNLFMATTITPCLKNPIFSNLGLCAACCAHFMCHHEFRPTSVSHPFSSLNPFTGPCQPWVLASCWPAFFRYFT